MSFPFSRTLRRSVVVAAVACFVTTAGVRAASKIQIAAIGDDAPGGGQFLGPALTGSPASAGDGWVAFRSLVTEGSTSEQIVVAKLTGQPQRFTVAALGQTPGKVGGNSLGTYKQFLGRPAVNANGDVAFVAALTNSDAIPGGAEHAGDPQPAGLFLFKRSAPGGAQLRIVALARDPIPGLGALDLMPLEDQITGASNDLLKRTPFLSDGGDVAFAAGAIDPQSQNSTAAILVAPGGNNPAPVVRLHDPAPDGVFAVLGSPSLNASGTLAFVATVDHGSDFSDDGVYTRDATGVVTRVARDGDAFAPPSDPENLQVLAGFGDLVDLNDVGDVAFAAGGMIDTTSFTSSDLEFGTLVAHAGAVHIVTFPGLLVTGYGRIRGGTLGPDGGSQVALPSLGPTGDVVVFGELTGGNGQGFFRASPPDYTVGLPLVVFGGTSPDASPIGGYYFAAESGPAVDALGNTTFFSRLAGAHASEALIFRPVSGTGNSIAVGEATPSKGRFGGPPFSVPIVNDADDVVFKSAIANGPSALGLFHWKNGTRTPLVRTGDAAPISGGPLILDLPGEASINGAGQVAFAALVAGIGRGAFVVDGGGVRKIALPNDPVPSGPAGALLDSIAINPLMMTDGSVVFRGSFAYADPVDPLGIVREEALFRMDASGVLTILVRTTQPSPTGTPFFRCRDAGTNGAMVAFRAPLGGSGDVVNDLPVGIFLVDPSSAVQTIAMQDQDPGIGKLLRGFSGRPSLDAAGNVTFLGQVGEDQHAVIVRRSTDGTSVALAEVGSVGPGNGTYRSLGRPAVASNGHIAYRASFEKTGGGQPGFFLTTGGTPRSFVAVGESDDDGTGGHLSSLNASGATNASDHLVFIASVSAGKTRNGLFMAAPASATLNTLRIRFREKNPNPKDPNSLPTTLGTMRGRFMLVPGDLGKSAVSADEAVTIAVSDALGTVITLDASKGSLAKKGRGLSLKGRNAAFRQLTVQSVRHMGVRVKFASAAFQAPFRDNDRIVPPLTLRIDVGAHSASLAVSCSVGNGTATCPGS